MEAPVNQGFDELAQQRDLTQLRLVSALADRAPRLVLKGGMAMRAIHGSVRLTKDVDFDAPPDLPLTTLTKQIGDSMQRAIRGSGLRDAHFDALKAGEGTARYRLRAVSPHSHQALSWVVEISRRTVMDPTHFASAVIRPPKDYAIGDFSVLVYGAPAMAGLKIAALLSDRRNVPRDVFDLDTLRRISGLRPLLTATDKRLLTGRQLDVAQKVSGIDFQQAQSELLPYLPAVVRRSFTRSAWESIQVDVALQVEAWLSQALNERASTEITDDPDHEHAPR